MKSLASLDPLIDQLFSHIPFQDAMASSALFKKLTPNFMILRIMKFKLCVRLLCYYVIFQYYASIKTKLEKSCHRPLKSCHCSDFFDPSPSTNVFKSIIIFSFFLIT